jgi:peptidoglycan/LPS O-acetylase OafA/YrhL
VARLARSLWIPAAIMVIAPPAIFPWNAPSMFLGGFTVVAVAAAIVLAAALQEDRLARLLGHAVFVWIGKRSYGLYLWHYPVMLTGLLQFHIPQSLTLAAIEISVAFPLAALSYRFVEYPFLQRRYAKPAGELRFARPD